MKILRPAGMILLVLFLVPGCSPYTEQERFAMQTVINEWSNSNQDLSFSDISTRESDEKQGRLLSFVEGKFTLVAKKPTQPSREHGFQVLFYPSGKLVSAYVDRKLIWPTCATTSSTSSTNRFELACMPWTMGRGIVKSCPRCSSHFVEPEEYLPGQCGYPCILIQSSS